MKKREHEKWDDFSDEVKESYETLGWNQDLWDNGGNAETNYLYWDQLTDLQKDAATKLGFDQEKWDNTTIEEEEEEKKKEGFMSKLPPWTLGVFFAILLPIILIITRGNTLHFL